MADALITKATNIGRRGHDDSYLTGGLVAGEALEAVSPVFVHSDGKVYMSNRTAHKATDSGAAFCCGFTDRAVAINQPVTIWVEGTEFAYADGTMTPGQLLFVSDTNGKLTSDEVTYDVALNGGGNQKIRVNQPVAYAKTDSIIVVL